MPDSWTPWPCARCGATFERDLTARGQSASWCPACRRSYRRSYRRNETSPRQPKAQRRCAQCDAVCVGATCRSCYHERVRANRTSRPIGRPRSAEPIGAKRISNDRRYKILRRSVMAEETHCGFCGERVDVSLRFPHPLSPSMDHIVPISRGGAAFDRSNVRLAHFSCNSVAGNGAFEASAVELLAFARAALWLSERLGA